MNELKQEIKSRLLEKLDHSMEMEDEAVQELVENEVWLMGKETYIPLAEKKRLCREIYYAIRKYDVLQELLEDETVTEIMVNGPDHIFIEKEGRLQQWQTAFESEDKLLDVIQQIVAKANRVVNESSPIVDARLFGSRVHVVLPPVALNGPILTIRRFGKTPLLIPELLRLGSVSQEICTFLEKLVIAGYNIFISGGTGSGKTTFLNALSSFIPRTERIITIEDSAELQIQGNDNLVRLETRNANVEGCKPVTIRDLIRASLRMRPDRIIVGEVRGAEAIDMLQALNTGHDGSLSTGHANSAADMIARLETMVLMGMELPLAAIRRQIAGGVDLIVHLGRLRDKSRRVLSVSEVVGYEQGEVLLSVLYEFQETGERNGKVQGIWKKTGSLVHTEKLQQAGITL
ncbi:CpaF family protein [Kineothrix sp. MSJ-39]|uniref:CpaF family protein n=1 Tax=Kineothrix sp. MSJ-39 TaxID=2841533 RepID=UPI001C1187D7|nr:CpaF family protein [Kineothrix sp. MSJ-39]MBU5429031.1 CpaF family protein [Kineothrix sp. MSJ-39]